MTDVPMTRGQRGREIGRAMIALAVVVIGLTVLLMLAPPMGPGPMYGEPGPGSIPGSVLLALIGIGGAAVGLAWMIRIHRADPEPDQHAWRYRARDRRTMVPRVSRGRWARMSAAAVTVLAIPVAVLAILIAAPGSFRASLIESIEGSLPIVPLIGVAGLIVGFAWLISVIRDEPEPDQRAWRYRRDR